MNSRNRTREHPGFEAIKTHLTITVINSFKKIKYNTISAENEKALKRAQNRNS